MKMKKSVILKNNIYKSIKSKQLISLTSKRLLL